MLKDSVLLLLLVALSISNHLSGQQTKVAVVDLDAIRSQSIIADWEQTLWQDAGYEEEAVRLVDSLQQKCLRVQRRVERCYLSPEALEEMQAEIERDYEEIRKLDGKIKAAKEIFPIEIDNFVRQQFMILIPKAKLSIGISFLSSSAPLFMEEGLADVLVDATPWFTAEFKNNPTIFEDWSAFRRQLIDRVEQGNW